MFGEREVSADLGDNLVDIDIKEDKNFSFYIISQNIRNCNKLHKYIFSTKIIK